MNARYYNISLVKDAKGRRHLPTVLYPNIPFNPRDIYVRTVPGDRLDLLAYEYYKDVRYWWIIAHANNLGKGSMAIPEGSQVRIPANPQTIQQLFNELNQR
jgi:phage tail protein X